MSATRVVWEGLDELRAMLRQMPAALASEAGPIVTGAADDAEHELEHAYPEKTGNLRRGLSRGQGIRSGVFGASAILKNNSPHAWIFENGTKMRHSIGGVAFGPMPASHLFVRTAMKHRRRMQERLLELCRRHGLEVTAGG